MRLILWPLCVLCWVPGERVAQHVDAATGLIWLTRGKVIWRGLPIVMVAEGYREDRGLLEHELEHVRQFWAGWFAGGLLLGNLLLLAFAADFALPAIGLMALLVVALPVAAHPGLYTMCCSYRLWAEVAAYRVQMRHPDRHGVCFPIEAAAARLLAPVYALELSAQEALAAIEGSQ